MGEVIKIDGGFLSLLEQKYYEKLSKAYDWAEEQRRVGGFKSQPIRVEFPNGDQLEAYSDDFTVSMFYNKDTGEALLRRDWEDKMAIQYNIVVNFDEIAKIYPNSVKEMLQNGLLLKKKWETY
jgi:hypothetical protein